MGLEIPVCTYTYIIPATSQTPNKDGVAMTSQRQKGRLYPMFLKFINVLFCFEKWEQIIKGMNILTITIFKLVKENRFPC